jgi:hypothetical protein
MMRGLFTIRPVTTATAAMGRYMPIVVALRALAVVRTMCVGWLLGEAGKSAFGAYNSALEMTNWALPLVLLGMDSIAERYAGVFELRGELNVFLARQRRALIRKASLAAVIGLIFAAITAQWIMHDRSWLPLLALTVAQMVVLGVYVWTAAILRGLRAFGVAAATEAVAAVGLLFLSIIAALRGNAAWLMLAYITSTLIPLLLAWHGLSRHLRDTHEETKTLSDLPGLGRFGRWNVLRGFMIMTFGALAINGVTFRTGKTDLTGDYAMVYRVAQVLAYISVTFWASAYTLTGRRWSAGCRKRAMYEQMQIGKIGSIGLLALGVSLVLVRPVIERLLPFYAPAIEQFLPGLVGVFIWYGIMGWLATLGDIREQPQFGTIIWIVAVVLQVGMLIGAGWIPRLADPRVASLAAQAIAMIGAVGVGLACMLIFDWSRAAAWPVLATAAATLAFLGPAPMARYLVLVAAGVVLIMLLLGGLLIRPREVKMLRALRGGPRHAPLNSASGNV